MGMKPRLNDSPKPIPGTVNNPRPVDEFANIQGTVSTLKVTPNAPIEGVEANKMIK
jgi:hypothetical protein